MNVSGIDADAYLTSEDSVLRAIRRRQDRRTHVLLNYDDTLCFGNARQNQFFIQRTDRMNIENFSGQLVLGQQAARTHRRFELRPGRYKCYVAAISHLDSFAELNIVGGKLMPCWFPGTR